MDHTEESQLISPIKLVKSYSNFSVSEQSELSGLLNTSNQFQKALEEESGMRGDKCLFHPSQKFKKGWDLIMGLLLTYTATLMPYEIAFFETEPWSVRSMVDLAIDCLFFCDILVTFNSAFVNSDGSYVTSRKQIALSYAQSWLIIDVLACIPLYLIDSQSSRTEEDYNNLLRLLRLSRVYRLMRISKLFKILKNSQRCGFLLKLQDYLNMSHSTLRVVKSVLAISLALHLMACIWGFVGKLEEFNPDSWMARHGFQNGDSGKIYLASIYWALTTLSTVGYGDISPKTNMEKLVAILWIIFCIYFISFNISNMTSLINASSTKERFLAHKLAGMDEFAKENNLNRKLRQELRHAIRYSDKKLGYSWNEKQIIFNELPKRLRFKVALAMHRGSIDKIGFFKNKDLAFIADIVPFLIPMMIKDKDFVYQVGDYAEEIYFVVTQKIEYAFDALVFRLVAAGGYFGDIEVMSEFCRKYDTQANGNVELLVMKRALVTKIHVAYLDVWKKMLSIAKERDRINQSALTQMAEWKTKMKNVGEHITEDLEDNIHLTRQKTMRIQKKIKEKKNRIDKNVIGIYETYRRCCQHVWMLGNTLRQISQEVRRMLKRDNRRSF